MSCHSVSRVLPALVLLAASASVCAAAPRVLVTISKETTYITEPLRPDGYPAYLAVLNQRYSQGVTPENNATVPFWKAMGPAEIHLQDRSQYFQMLGMTPLPEKGDYFVTSESHIVANEDVESATPTNDRGKLLGEQLQATTKRPWSKREFPVWAEWLAANEKPLALVVEASKRPRRFDPLVGGPRTPLIGVLQPASRAYRKVTEALAARAMLRLGEGELDAAWEDTLACHRLARLVAQGPTTIDHLVANGIEDRASRGACALLQHPGLTAAKIAELRKDFDHLPPLSLQADKIDLAERFTYLDNVLVAARDTPPTPAAIARSLAQVRAIDSNASYLAATQIVLESSGNATIDWDAVLRMGNARFDLFVSILRKPAGVKRFQEVKAADQSEAAMFKATDEKETSGQSSPDENGHARSRRVGQAFLATFASDLSTQLTLDDRTTMWFALTKLAFALAAYRADNNSYPEKLVDLTPKYISSVPQDIFSGSQLHYSPKRDGYTLYSVGSNGKDDAGKSYDDRKNNEDWDDLTVRMSPASH
jgi:hypothetical protein